MKKEIKKKNSILQRYLEAEAAATQKVQVRHSNPPGALPQVLPNNLAKPR